MELCCQVHAQVCKLCDGKFKCPEHQFLLPCESCKRIMCDDCARIKYHRCGKIYSPELDGTRGHKPSECEWWICSRCEQEHECDIDIDR